MGENPGKYSKRYEGISRTGTPFAVDVLRERFLGPEIFFSPHTNSGSGDDRARVSGFALGCWLNQPFSSPLLQISARRCPS